MVDLSLVSGAKFGIDTAKAFTAFWRRSKGHERALLAEMKRNRSCLEMVVKDDVELAAVIEQLSTQRFDTLRDNGYNFNSLRFGKIKKYPGLEGNKLAKWSEKSTGQLVENIYEGLHEILIRYPIVGDSPRYRWNVRVKNLLEKSSLLIRHLGA